MLGSVSSHLPARNMASMTSATIAVLLVVVVIDGDVLNVPLSPESCASDGPTAAECYKSAAAVYGITPARALRCLRGCRQARVRLVHVHDGVLTRRRTRARKRASLSAPH